MSQPAVSETFAFAQRVPAPAGQLPPEGGFPASVFLPLALLLVGAVAGGFYVVTQRGLR